MAYATAWTACAPVYTRCAFVMPRRTILPVTCGRREGAYEAFQAGRNGTPKKLFLWQTDVRLHQTI